MKKKPQTNKPYRAMIGEPFEKMLDDMVTNANESAMNNWKRVHAERHCIAVGWQKLTGKPLPAEAARLLKRHDNDLPL